MSLATAFLLYVLLVAVAYILIDPHLLWRKPVNELKEAGVDITDDTIIVEGRDEEVVLRYLKTW